MAVDTSTDGTLELYAISSFDLSLWTSRVP
jgi:hypothetical protein